MAHVGCAGEMTSEFVHCVTQCFGQFLVYLKKSLGGHIMSLNNKSNTISRPKSKHTEDQWSQKEWHDFKAYIFYSIPIYCAPPVTVQKQVQKFMKVEKRRGVLHWHPKHLHVTDLQTLLQMRGESPKNMVTKTLIYLILSLIIIMKYILAFEGAYHEDLFCMRHFHDVCILYYTCMYIYF